MGMATDRLTRLQRIALSQKYMTAQSGANELLSWRRRRKRRRRERGKGGQDRSSSFRVLALTVIFEVRLDISVHILQFNAYALRIFNSSGPQCLIGDLDLVICFTVSHRGSVLFPLLSEHQSFNHLTGSWTVSLGIAMGSRVLII